ncbi:hypothetical protein AG1IA_03480 [Rhizoctonia solani AG-1 IA]|uniref:Uncharacterized protein n=1 Tax=Thanatephorus cucumeris (strain AG1-IA) TaxID=983506 RepID=L8WWT7_THACA|nr:hypothetical protein AG1IA_03480 [Rhizoctonia solani AG-1 IA]
MRRNSLGQLITVCRTGGKSCVIAAIPVIWSYGWHNERRMAVPDKIGTYE